MYRVLQILEGASVGGVTTVVLNYYHYINKEKIHFDFGLTAENVEQSKILFEQFGAKVYQLPQKSKGIRVYEQELRKILKKEQYDAVHVHENETSYIALRVAKKAGVKNRFAHSHTSSPYRSALGEVRRISGCILNYHYATTVIACGQLAGERVFGKWNMRRRKATVLPNAVDTSRLAFDQAVRQEMREILGISGRYVVGMIGRLAPEKNCAYGLHIIEQLHEADPTAVLLIVGTGEEETEIQTKVWEQSMSEYVKLLGRRDDISDICQALDVLIMPSFHEGFPIVAVEAMASGLPILLSSTITKELGFGSGVRYLALGNDGAWIDALQWAKKSGRECVKRQEEVKDRGFDIRDAVKQLEKIYLTGC